jgi:hypothetical protein
MVASECVIDAGGNKYWYVYDGLHRIGSPAVEYASGRSSWWLYSKCYKKSDYDKLVSNLPLLYWKRFKEGLWV